MITDIPELVALLQCMDFVLHKFKLGEDLNFSNTASSIPENDNNVLRLEVSCSASGMKAEMSKVIGICKCPSKDDTNQAQFWSITGYGPKNEVG